MRIFGFCVIMSLIPFGGWTQDTDILLNHDLYHYIDRLDIKGLTGRHIHTALKPYGRAELVQIFRDTDSTQLYDTEYDWHQRMHVLVDDSYAQIQGAKGVFNTFYKNGRDLFAHQSDNFQIYVNPFVHFAGGLEAHTFNSPDWESIALSVNTRGLVVRGSVFDKIGYYTEITENLTRFPQFIYRPYESEGYVQGETFVREFRGENALDYFGSRAYLTFQPVQGLRVKFGRDRAFWGNGFQSLMLNDQAPDYLFLNFRARFWKLEYTTQLMQLLEFIPNKQDGEGTFPRKYAALHQLSFQPNDRLSIGLFESVIFNPFLANGRRGFELQYLNPLIFFQSIEEVSGSPDNSFLGLTWKYNFLKHFQSYGQFLLDDYNFSRRDEGSGYWGNKFGYQVGVKYIDAFTIPTLDLQFEYNRIRPYTYQHFNVSANYAHFAQSLGHSNGANLSDWQFIVRMHPFPAWNLHLAYRSQRQGVDGGTTNYGGDINRSYTVNRFRDFDNEIAQGNLFEISQLYGRLTCQLWNTDAYLEVEGRYRTENEQRSVYILGGLRVGIPTRVTKF